ncbi:MAG: hypothetical protein R3336_01430 [Phycisphaeraceae bacterium]|nr:hypothetical protein [Phycisphaeraceae bacterium]
MKLKNVNFFEKHVEKFVLGVAVLIALLVLGIYFAGNPYAVEMRMNGVDRTVEPDEIEAYIYEEAQDLDAKIQSDQDYLPPLVIPDYTEKFQRRIRQRVVGVQRFEVPPGLPGLEGFDGDGGPPIVVYHVPPPPAVTNLSVRKGFAVLDAPEDAELLQAYQDMIGDARPMDFRYASVGAVFSMEDWRRLLRAQPGPGLERIPEDWWRGFQAITDVRLYRQRWDSQAGDWVEETELIAPLPGAFSARVVQRPITHDRAEFYVLNIKKRQDEITRPKFPGSLRGRPWLPPDADSDMLNLSPDQQRQLFDINQKIQSLKARIDEASAASDQPVDPEMGPSRNYDQSTTPVRALQMQLAELVAERNELLGVETDEPTGTSSGGTSGQGTGSVGEQEGYALDEVRLWAHDMTAQPGETYRYQIKVGLLNPLFRRTDLSPEQREQYIDKLTLESEPSEWSEPVKIAPKYRFFAVGANRDRQYVNVEVWRVFDGTWRRRDFVVRPGDLIGSVVSMPTRDGLEVQVDMSVNAVAIDIDFRSSQLGSFGSDAARLLYQPLDGETTIKSRRVDEDEDSLERLKLRNLEASLVADRTSGASSSANR